MIYFRVLGTLVFHLFFKKIIVTLVPFIFKENSKIVFVSIYLDFIAGKTNVCQIECYSIVNCNFFSSTVRQASGRYDDSILRQNYANFRDLENEAENANRSRVIICQHNGNTNETV